ncbi:MAG TPA: efflux RND transporter periplasmic adaptor subunit, partial [Prolixibacteraceae bacterium]|nr:efflux RND transporter periplasmic adaptor subunit [Prolixibacteraceae bacterium]
LSLMAIVLLMACNTHKNDSMLTYLVATSTFSESLLADGTVEAVNSRTLVCPESDEYNIKFLIDDGTLVKAGDTVCILENKQLVDQYENAIKNLELSKAEYNKIQADLALDLALLEAQVKNNEAQTSITNLDSAQLQYASPTQKKITELELKIAQIQKEKFEHKLSAVKRINQFEIRKAELRIRQNENNVKRWEEQLLQLVLLTPIDGLAMRSISWVTGNKVIEGETAYPPMPLIEIPDLSLMRLAFSVSETEYKRIKVGQKVEYTFDAMPGNSAQGSITYRSSVGRELSRNSKVKLFDMQASIDTAAVLPGAGLSARARIIITQIPDTIVVPTVAIFDEDSTKVVFVKHGNRYNKQEIITAESSQKETIVAAGLQPGDVLALAHPKASQVGKFIALPADVKQKLSKLIRTNSNGTDSVSPSEVNSAALPQQPITD